MKKIFSIKSFLVFFCLTLILFFANTIFVDKKLSMQNFLTNKNRSKKLTDDLRSLPRQKLYSKKMLIHLNNRSYSIAIDETATEDKMVTDSERLKSNISINDQCFEKLESLRQLDLNTLFVAKNLVVNDSNDETVLLNVKLPQLDKAVCAYTRDNYLLDAIDGYKNTCLGIASNQVSKKMAQRCQNAIFKIRYFATEILTSGVPFNEINDIKILTDKLFASFASGNLYNASEIAKRFLDFDPGYSPAHKAIIVSKFITIVSTKEIDKYMALKKEFQDIIEKSSEIDAIKRDKEIVEMNLLSTLLSPMDNEYKKKFFNEIVEKNSNSNEYFSAFGNYCLAAIEFKNKNTDGAIAFLKKAISIYSNDARFINTLELIQADQKNNLHKENLNPFQFTTGITILSN